MVVAPAAERVLRMPMPMPVLLPGVEVEGGRMGVSKCVGVCR